MGNREIIQKRPLPNKEDAEFDLSCEIKRMRE